MQEMRATPQAFTEDVIDRLMAEIVCRGMMAAGQPWATPVHGHTTRVVGLLEAELWDWLNDSHPGKYWVVEFNGEYFAVAPGVLPTVWEGFVPTWVFQTEARFFRPWNARR